MELQIFLYAVTQYKIIEKKVQTRFYFEIKGTFFALAQNTLLFPRREISLHVSFSCKTLGCCTETNDCYTISFVKDIYG